MHLIRARDAVETTGYSHQAVITTKKRKKKGEEKMIFAVGGHVDMIRNGLHHISPASVLYHPMPQQITKTQTRRVNRGIYQVGKSYAVQRKRGVKAESDIRIVMDKIWEEDVSKPTMFYKSISASDAHAEGGYTPKQFEKLFAELNPKWDGWSRWAFLFHCIEVRK
jgi:hypothetical protein